MWYKRPDSDNGWKTTHACPPLLSFSLRLLKLAWKKHKFISNFQTNGVRRATELTWFGRSLFCRYISKRWASEHWGDDAFNNDGDSMSSLTRWACGSLSDEFRRMFRKLFWHSSGATGCCCWHSSYLLRIQTNPSLEIEGESQIAKFLEPKMLRGKKQQKKKKKKKKRKKVQPNKCKYRKKASCLNSLWWIHL